MRPSRDAFTPDERRLLARLRTPAAVQGWLNALPYNREAGGETLRSFRGVVRHGTAHCLEAALAAAVILEQHGYPPRVLSFESEDKLDHVIFAYRRAGRWGAVARSRDPGLHGRRAVFANARALALSYVEPYVDFTGRILAYAVVDLDEEMDGYDWRLSERNVWKAEQMLIDYRHRAIRTSDTRIERWRRWYYRFRREHPGRKPTRYPGRERWTALPPEFAAWDRADQSRSKARSGRVTGS
jgi:hypothetical protein